MIAALPLSPAPMPSHAPAAIPTMFFNAPAYSTPIVSVVLYTRRYGPVHASRTAFAHVSSPATTVAAGSPRAISTAMFGPLSAAIRPLESSPRISRSTAVIVRSRCSSKPLAALTSIAAGGSTGTNSVTTGRIASVGTARMTISASPTVAARSALTATRSSSDTSLRYAGLWRVRARTSATPGSRAHIATSLDPSRASACASAVPHDPAPTIAILMTQSSDSSRRRVTIRKRTPAKPNTARMRFSR